MDIKLFAPKVITFEKQFRDDHNDVKIVVNLSDTKSTSCIYHTNGCHAIMCGSECKYDNYIHDQLKNHMVFYYHLLQVLSHFCLLKYSVKIELFFCVLLYNGLHFLFLCSIKMQIITQLIMLIIYMHLNKKNKIICFYNLNHMIENEYPYRLIINWYWML